LLTSIVFISHAYLRYRISVCLIYNIPMTDPMINPELTQGWEEFQTGAITLRVGMDVTIPGDENNPSIRIFPTEEDKQGGDFATAYLNLNDLGIASAEDEGIRKLYFKPDQRKIYVNRQINLEDYEIESPGKGSKRKFYVIGGIAATAATGLIVRQLRKR